MFSVMQEPLICDLVTYFPSSSNPQTPYLLPNYILSILQYNGNVNFNINFIGANNPLSFLVCIDLPTLYIRTPQFSLERVNRHKAPTIRVTFFRYCI